METWVFWSVSPWSTWSSAKAPTHLTLQRYNQAIPVLASGCVCLWGRMPVQRRESTHNRSIAPDPHGRKILNRFNLWITRTRWSDAYHTVWSVTRARRPWLRTNAQACLWCNKTQQGLGWDVTAILALLIWWAHFPPRSSLWRMAIHNLPDKLHSSCISHLHAHTRQGRFT